MYQNNEIIEDYWQRMQIVAALAVVLFLLLATGWREGVTAAAP